MLDRRRNHRGGIGIVGGIGPRAGAAVYERLIRRTLADHDEDHPRVVIVANKVPSRVSNIIASGPSPVPALVEALRVLEEAGVDVIALASVTTHAFLPELRTHSRVPLVDIVPETYERVRGYTRPLLLCTEATRTAGLFQRYDVGNRCGYPDPREQEQVNQLIELVKSGRDEHTWTDRLGTLFDWAAEHEADAVILGCTELSAIAPPQQPLPVLDVADVFADVLLAWVTGSGHGLSVDRTQRSTLAST